MQGKRKLYCHGIKRILAVVLSLMGLICLSWLYLILVIAVKGRFTRADSVPAEADRDS